MPHDRWDNEIRGERCHNLQFMWHRGNFVHALCWKSIEWLASSSYTGIILDMGSASERWHYIVIPSLIGWVHIQLGMGSANERWCYTVTSSLIGWAHTLIQMEYIPSNMQMILLCFVLLWLYNHSSLIHVIHAFIISDGLPHWHWDNHMNAASISEITLENKGKLGQYQTTTELNKAWLDDDHNHRNILYTAITKQQMQMTYHLPPRKKPE